METLPALDRYGLAPASATFHGDVGSTSLEAIAWMVSHDATENRPSVASIDDDVNVAETEKEASYVLITSLLLATAGCVTPFLLNRQEFGPALSLSFVGAFFWIVLLTVSLVRYKWRGFWVFAGAPLALFWPYAIILMIWHCGQDQFACP